MPKISLIRRVKKNPAMFFGSILIVFLSLGILTYRLTTLHPNPNVYEAYTLERLKYLSEIFSNPLDFVYLFVAKAFSIIFSNLTALRLTSILFSVFTLINIRFIIKYWYDTRTANLAVLLTVTSFWFLILARVGSPFIMLAFWVSSLVSLYAWSKYAKKPKISKFLIAMIVSLGFYSPYFVLWIIAMGAILVHKYGYRELLSKLKTPLIFIPLLALSPLIYACFDTNVLKQLIGASSTGMNPVDYIANITGYLLQITFMGKLDPSLNLGRLPYLDIFQMFMLSIGLTVLYSQRSMLKGKLMLLTPLIYIAIISIYPVELTKLALLVPIVFISISAGVNEFISLWLKGFPRNPFGRAIGLLLIAGLIGASGYYNLNRYFNAWAQNPDVKAAHLITK